MRARNDLNINNKNVTGVYDKLGSVIMSDATKMKSKKEVKSHKKIRTLIFGKSDFKLGGEDNAQVKRIMIEDRIK